MCAYTFASQKEQYHSPTHVTEGYLRFEDPCCSLNSLSTSLLFILK